VTLVAVFDQIGCLLLIFVELMSAKSMLINTRNVLLATLQVTWSTLRGLHVPARHNINVHVRPCCLNLYRYGTLTSVNHTACCHCPPIAVFSLLHA